MRQLQGCNLVEGVDGINFSRKKKVSLYMVSKW